MGINTEMVFLMSSLERQGYLQDKRRVVELGAQVVSAHPESMLAAERKSLGEARGEAPQSAAEFYRRYGLQEYVSLDAGGVEVPGKVIADLNRPLPETLFLGGSFHVVTNLGTSEHCFNQAQFFATAHDLCARDGLMIHVLCTQGLVNHGYFNYHPRFVWELALANTYDLLDLSFTVDFTPRLLPYALESFRAYDSRDLMLYAVLRKRYDAPFAAPFDGLFAAENQVAGYRQRELVAPREFDAYIKTTWENATAPDAWQRGPVESVTTPWSQIKALVAKLR